MPGTHLNLLSFVSLPVDVLAALEASPYGRFTVQSASKGIGTLAEVAATHFDGLLLDGARAEEARAVAGHAAADTATLVVDPETDPARALEWLRHGAQDVLMPAELAVGTLPMRLRAAIERKRLERDARKAFATDLETGLPHQQQLIEHMSQLLALREREPAPMAVLALRIEGLAAVEARHGREPSQVLRRRVAVRLRAGVRASDVVASIGDDSFAVLLGSVLTPADAEAVGTKLLQALLAPFRLGTDQVALGVALGIAQYPGDGSQPDGLLRRATGLAAAAMAQHASAPEVPRAPHRTAAAANDESV